MKRLISTVVTLLSLSSFGFSQSVTLESVTGLDAQGRIPVNQQVTFNLRVTASTTTNHGGITNGFKVFSPNGATWTATTGDTLVPGWKGWFDLIYAINLYSTDGMLADTVSFGGSRLFGTGLPAGFDQVAYAITIGPVPPADHGKTIVLDSSFYGTSGVWKWLGATAAVTFFPAWSGPHSYTVHDPNAPSGGTLEITPPTLVFSAEQFGPNPPAQVFTVSEVGGQNIAIDVSENSTWLSLSGIDGVTPDEISAMVDITGLPAGVSTDSIAISSTEADNSPQYVVVTLEITEPLKYLEIDPTVLNFSAVAGHSNPAGQAVNVSEVNDFNIPFESTEDAPWMILQNASGMTPAQVTVTVDITGLDPDNYMDTIHFTSSEVAEDGMTYQTLVYLEVLPNSIPVITPIGNVTLDPCQSLVAIYSASDADSDPLTLWLETLVANMSFVDNGNGTSNFSFSPSVAQSGADYPLTFFAADGIDTVSESFTISVPLCEQTVEPHAVIQPEMMFAFFLHALDPMTGQIYFGDFNDGHNVSDVDASSLTMNGNVIPTGTSILPSHPDFVGSVMEVEFPINDFLDPYMPFYDTTVEEYLIEGSFNDAQTFSIVADVRLRGHLSGDFNLDGRIDIADLLAFVDFSFNDGPAPAELYVMDLSGDNQVDITDLLTMVENLFF